MEAAGLWVALVAACAALGGAVFAYVQARAATDTLKEARDARDESRLARDESVRLAGEANAAFVRQAEAQEEANRLKIAENTPPDWSGPSWVTGELFKVINTSKRTIIVDEFDVKPDGTQGHLHLESPNGMVFEYGDAFEYVAAGGWGVEPKKLTVKYHFDGDDERHEFIIPL